MKTCIVSDSHDRAEPLAEVIRQPNIRGGETLLVNPGSVSGIGAPNVDEAYTWILGDLDDMTFEIHTLKY